MTLNYTGTEVTQETELLSAADVLAIERGVPRIRWNAALNQQVGRVGLLGRSNQRCPAQGGATAPRCAVDHRPPSLRRIPDMNSSPAIRSGDGS